MRKSCRECGVEKPLSSFYIHSAMADGHLNKCKECVKTRVKLHRSNNIDHFRAYDTERYQRPNRKTAHKKQSSKWRKRYPKKYQAQTAVNNAIRDGKLIRQACERCKREDHVHAHHDDYDKPLEIMWLCPPCHSQRHKELESE